MTSYLRPDELAALSEIERSQSRERKMKGALKLGTTAATTALGAGISGKILPFLSEYIPMDLAMKGISKVSPRLGEFLKQGQSMGLNVKDGLNFIKEQIQGQSQQEKPKESRNIIQQYSDTLHEFLNNEINKGRSPIEAGALAQNDKRFKSIIKKISEDHKTPWSNIIESVYGTGESETGRREALGKFNKKVKQPGMVEEEIKRFEQGYGQQQPGKGQQALMAILQRLQQARGIR